LARTSLGGQLRLFRATPVVSNSNSTAMELTATPAMVPFAVTAVSVERQLMNETKTV
jgi:hypothetical protein